MRKALAFVVTLTFMTAGAAVAQERAIRDAEHKWNDYHWSMSGSAITPPVHDNVDSRWDSYFNVAMSDWNSSAVIDSPYGSAYGPISATKRCTSETGKIEVCNDRYGRTGWLGIAGISVSGGHITKGYTKLNDTYFDTEKYNKPAWRAFVMCQEIGHDYGLGHVNENFDDPNTGSCMDYTSDPSGKEGTNGTLSNEHPNKHDYDMLSEMYSHKHASSLPMMSASARGPRAITVDELLAGADQWGTPVSFDGNGRPNVFVLRTITPNHGDHNDGEISQITHVLWAPVDPFDYEGVAPRTPNFN